jgi:hypothetical protein
MEAAVRGDWEKGQYKDRAVSSGGIRGRAKHHATVLGRYHVRLEYVRVGYVWLGRS